MEAGYGMTEQAMSQQDRYRGDENLYVKFFLEPIQNREKTIKEGRPIFEEVECISIMVPGDKDNVVVRAVREDDKERFAKHYQAFKRNEADLIEGTPLEKWNFITKAQVEELRYFNIRTVEQLATVSDSNAQKFMGIQVLKARAKEYIDASSQEAPVLQLQEELQSRDDKISEQSEIIAALQERISKLEKSGKK